MSSGQESSAGYEDAEEDPGMALTKTTLDELQVYATKVAMKDGKNNEMLMDVISKFCAAALLSLENGEVIKVSVSLKKDIDKYNREIRKGKAKAEEEAKALVKAEAEAKAKAEAEAQAQVELSNLPSMAELEAETQDKIDQVSFCVFDFAVVV